LADPAANMEMNTGSQGTPTWSSIMGAGGEWRFSDAHVAANTASASWPQTTRSASAQQLNFLHAYTADATGDWVAGAQSGGAPPSNYNQCRWNNSVSGTYASAPVLTAYPTTAHGAISRGDGSILGGHASDTGATARAYLKGDVFGRAFQTAADTPAAAPTGAFPTITDGSTGSLVGQNSAAWSNNAGAWQGLQGGNDYITSAAASWDGTSGKVWYFMLACFMGPNLTPGTLVPVCTLSYSWT
jgi:hypothetical protein